MKIRKGAWHTKIYSSLREGELPNSLCEYTWTLILHCFLWLSFTFIVFTIILALIMSARAMILLPESTLDPKSTAYHNLETVAELGYVIYSVLAIVFVLWLSSRKKYILTEYIKALFKRMCPRINWVD